MACNLKNVLSTSSNCRENPAGVSNHVMVLPLKNITISVDDSKNEYIITPKTGTALTAFRIDFKSQTGQVTSEDNGPGKGWTHTGTGRVELSEDDMALVSRTLHNGDKFIYLFPTGTKNNRGTEYKVVGNVFGETEYTVTADTGAARGDDHGQTFSVSCGYQVYPVMKWFGTVNTASDGTFSDDSGDDETYGSN